VRFMPVGFRCFNVGRSD